MPQVDGTLLSTTFTQARAEFDDLVKEIRPELHRYCARMTGSVIDGEDVVQEALAKAYYALATTASISNMRSWLFRIAHNKAIDHLRRYDSNHSEPLDDQLPQTTREPSLESKELARVALSRFLELPPMQRSCVILKDALDCSLNEIAELLDVTLSTVKAALHRGRTRVRSLASELEAGIPMMAASETALLHKYVEAFEARNFDTVRAMLAEDVRLDLIGRAQRRGVVEVSGYFTNYDRLQDWQISVGSVEGKPAVIVSDSAEPTVDYFILIEWDCDRVGMIRDYRYARHVMDGVEIAVGK